MSEIRLSEPYLEARRFAVRSLAKLAQSSQQMRGKLLRKGYTEELVEELIAELLERGWIDDRSLLHTTVANRAERYGQRRIRQEMLFKGYSEDKIEEAIATLQEEKEEETLLRELQKSVRGADLSDRSLRDKVIRTLIRKGFNYDAIRRAIEQMEGER